MTSSRLGSAVLLGFTLLPCFGFGLGAAPAHSYEVTGVVVSSRDGSPVPYCRLTAEAVPSNQVGSARGAAGPGAGPGGQGRTTSGRGSGMQGSRSNVGAGQAIEIEADASGRFSLELPHAGAWRLSGAARGFHNQNYDEHEGFYSAVVLTESAPAIGLTFRMVPNSSLSGQVFDEAGEPVAAAQVWAELIPPQVPGGSGNADRPRIAGAGQTDDLGRYEVGALDPGSYRVRVQAQPWYSASRRGGVVNGGMANSSAVPAPDRSLDLVYATTWFPGTDDETAAQIIRLGPGEQRQADFQLTAIPAVHLRVPRVDAGGTEPQNRRGGQPQQRPAFINRISGAAGSEQTMQATGNGSEWDFSGLTPGTYEVRLPGPDGRPDGDVRQIEVRAGSQTVITMDSARALIPVALKLDGFGDSQIEFINTESGQRYTSTPQFRGRRGFGRDDQGDGFDEPDGRTLLVPAHQYEVYSTGGSGAYLAGLSAKGAKTAGRLVTIDGPATVTLHMANTHAQVEGVARLGGKPAAGAMVLLVPASMGEPGDFIPIQRDETNTDGTFLIANVVPGRYILVAIDHGWDVQWRSPETLAGYLMHGTPVDVQTVTKVREEIEAVPR